MSIQIAEQRPPRVQFVHYLNATNAGEAGLITGLDATVDGSGVLTLKSPFSVSGLQVSPGDFVVQSPNGTQVFTSQADFDAAYAVIA